MQAAVFAGDFSGLEDAAAASGADAAAVLCYLDAAFDGEAPGACPTMYFRDATSTIANARSTKCGSRSRPRIGHRAASPRLTPTSARGGM